MQWWIGLDINCMWKHQGQIVIEVLETLEMFFSTAHYEFTFMLFIVGIKVYWYIQVALHFLVTMDFLEGACFLYSSICRVGRKLGASGMCEKVGLLTKLHSFSREKRLEPSTKITTFSWPYNLRNKVNFLLNFYYYIIYLFIVVWRSEPSLDAWLG